MTIPAQILVVEDEAILAMGLERRLEKLGYRLVAVTDSGEEALQHAAESCPDLVLMDIKLPGDMDGIETADLIRERYNIPVVYLTAHADPETLERAKITSPVGYLLKPVEERELHVAIEMALYQHKMEQALQRRNKELALLNQAGQAFNSTLDLTQVFALVLEEARRLLEVMACSIWLVEAGTGELVCRHATGPQSQHVRGWRLDRGAGIAGSTALSGQSLNIADAWADERHCREVGQRTGLAPRSILSVPLKVRDKVIGVLQVVDSEVGRFDQADLALLEPLAASAATAIENARLYEQAQQEIAERKRIEVERQKLQDQLVQAQKMEALGHLTGGIAHDFNNLLMAINGFAELIQTQLSPEDPIGEMADHILDAGQRARNLVRQLLVFSRQQVAETQIVDLNKTMTGLDKMLRRVIEEHVEIIFEPGPNLWPIMADPAQVEQVIINLAINARDALPEGGQITIGTSNLVLDQSEALPYADLAAGEYVLLTVRDNGIGISAEVMTHIFEPFFTTKERDKGTGLGLATCYGVVKQNGGHIWVDSAVGQGTTFKIFWPRAVEKTALPAQFKWGAAQSEGRGTETILVVEDDYNVRKLIVGTLRRHGYNILEAEDGRQALELFQRHPAEVHLVLTDVIMPHMGGKALINQLRDLQPDLDYIFISGYVGDTISLEEELAQGATFIQKPLSLVSLARQVRELLDAPNGAGAANPTPKAGQTALET